MVLALTQSHLVSCALHAAHHHLCHVTAIPIPGFLRHQQKGGKKTQRKANETHLSEIIIHSCRGQRVVSFCSEKHMFGCQMRTYCIKTKMTEILRTRFRGKDFTCQYLNCCGQLSIRLSSKKVGLLLAGWMSLWLVRVDPRPKRKTKV